MCEVATKEFNKTDSTIFWKPEISCEVQICDINKKIRSGSPPPHLVDHNEVLNIIDVTEVIHLTFARLMSKRNYLIHELPLSAYHNI